ncbi:MAG: hypothetical protein GX639_18255 [Fibrobacter sp.]|nr:hypothetical protein [Fibrobacter sp.]
MLSIPATFSMIASIFSVNPLRIAQQLVNMRLLNPSEVFLRLFDIEVIKGNHDIQIVKVISLNGHFMFPNLADIIPLIELK